MNLNRSTLSFIITFFSMSLIVLSLYNIHLGAKVEEEYIIEMSLEEEIIEELEETIEENNANSTPIKSHLAYNETAKPSYGNPEPLKTLDEIIAEKETSTESGNPSEISDSSASYAASLKELAKKRQEKQQLLGEKDANKEIRTSNYARRNTSVSYSLVDRNNVSLPIPIYTCIEGGKVVINIKVDPLGNVIDAELNKKSSSTNNGCLVDNAITYAIKSKFNNVSKGSYQKGTITYLFQSK